MSLFKGIEYADKGKMKKTHSTFIPLKNFHKLPQGSIF